MRKIFLSALVCSITLTCCIKNPSEQAQPVQPHYVDTLHITQDTIHTEYTRDVVYYGAGKHIDSTATITTIVDFIQKCKCK